MYELSTDVWINEDSQVIYKDLPLAHSIYANSHAYFSVPFTFLHEHFAWFQR